MRLSAVILLTASLCACEGLTSDTADTTSGQTTSGENATCESDLRIGTGAQNADGQLGENCTPSSEPTNCLDGSFIEFGDTGECVCIARCSSLNLSQGASCDQNGLYVCQTVTGASGGPYCVARSWNICGDATGTGGGDDGNDGMDGNEATTGGDETDGQTCKPDGLACEDDAECCSMTCFASGCG
jgi:hypothetical protein